MDSFSHYIAAEVGVLAQFNVEAAEAWQPVLKYPHVNS